jgi:hypothetical protein
MKENNSDETFFREIMSKSKLGIPFSDFDDKLMELIGRRHSKKTSISRDIKLSWIFFILGSAFGIILSIILPELQETLFGIPIEDFRLLFLIIFAFLLITQLDSLIDIYKRQRN